MYRIVHSVAEVKLRDYIDNYRDVNQFIVYCKQCNRYNSCWACPPFNFSTDELLSFYDIAYIIGTKIILNNEIIRNNTDWEMCTKISYEVIEKVRLDLDKKLLALEKQNPQSKAFFAGTCHICQSENCTRIQGKPCIAPEKVRPSLESFGFDVSKTSLELLNIEMKWSQNGILPKYFTLVSGLLTTREIIIANLFT